MKAILCLALLLTLSAAYYEKQTQCCTSGQYWSNSDAECKACNASCTDCDENSEGHDNNDLTGCVCAGANCAPKMCDGSGCTACTDDTYNLSSGACFKCTDSNCTACSAAAATCTACAAKFALVGTSCQGCSVGCSVCVNSTTCQKCSDEFFLGADICSSCNVSPVSNCNTCDAGGCKTCDVQYGLLSDGTCVSCTDANCSVCNGAAAPCGTCKTDQAQMYVLKSDGTCTQCDAGCAGCSGDNGATCTSCKVEFYHDSNASTCTACEGTCLTCDGGNATDCLSCKDATDATDLKILKADKTCVLGCKVKTSDTQCGECIADTDLNNVMFLHSAGYCIACTAGCKECTDTGAADCTTCSDGWKSDNAGGCTNCNATNMTGSRCVTCTTASNDGTACIDCPAEGYFGGGGAATCVPCDVDQVAAAWTAAFSAGGCVTCAAADVAGGNCTGTTCIATHYWDEAAVAGNALQCKPCGDHCTACTKANGCSACETNTSSEQGFRKVTTTDAVECTECTSAFCYECTAVTQCSKCMDTYYVKSDGTDCLTCGSPNSGKACATCTAVFVTGVADAISCTACAAGDVLYQGTCGDCAASCTNCGSLTGGAGVIGACDECDAGFYLTLNTCTACSANCKVCTAADNCTTCMTGYMKNSSNACDACSANCSGCSVAGQCTDTAACDDMYYKSADDGKCVKCANNCKECTSGTACTTPEDKFYLDNGVATTCGNNCKACTTSTCGTCEDEFFLDTTCKACGNNCKTCSAADQCSVCMPGYVQVGGACEACAKDCTTCTEKDTCNTDGCSLTFVYMTATKDCAATITSAACKTNEYFKDNLCTECGAKCMTCSDTVCTMCEDQHGPVANSTECKACTATVTGMKTCTSALSVAMTCESGYGLIATTCTKCSVGSCMDCAAADTCAMCNDGYGLAQDNKSCVACPEGCKACTSDCMRSCTACIETGKVAPNCGCAKNETWKNNKCDGEEKAETKTEVTPTPIAVVSANILKFAAIVLIALIALL